MKLFLAILLASSIASGVAAQRQGLQAKVTKSRPSVFISFLRAGEIEPLDARTDRHYFWLRISNNLKWPIWLEGSTVPRSHGDVALYYAVEDAKTGNKLYGDIHCHICSGKRLASGQSFVFIVPRDDLSEGHRIRIGFSMGWENETDVAFGREVEHSVLFSASRLPRAVLTR